MMRKLLLKRRALKEVNLVRQQMGAQRLRRLPRGIIINPEECVMARSFQDLGWVKFDATEGALGVYAAPQLGLAMQATLGCEVLPGDGYWLVTPTPTMAELITQFDSEALPELVAFS